MARHGGETQHQHRDGLPGLMQIILFLNAVIVLGALLFVFTPPSVGAPVLIVAVGLALGPLAAPALAAFVRSPGRERSRRVH